jgi:hypothetical protein
MLNSIRLCIMNDEHDKVFSYIEMLHFTQSLKLCIKLCGSLQQHTLANKVSQYLKEKEQRTLIEQSHKKVVPQALDSRQVGNCLKEPIVQEEPKNDLAQFAVNKTS